MRRSTRERASSLSRASTLVLSAQRTGPLSSSALPATSAMSRAFRTRMVTSWVRLHHHIVSRNLTLDGCLVHVTEFKEWTTPREQRHGIHSPESLVCNRNASHSWTLMLTLHASSPTIAIWALGSSCFRSDLVRSLGAPPISLPRRPSTTTWPPTTLPPWLPFSGTTGPSKCMFRFP